MAAALVGAIEWALVVEHSARLFSGRWQMLKLLLVCAGNWLPYAFVGVLAWRLAALAIARVSQVTSQARARLAVAGAFALLLLPYSYWLAKFTFSGPRARVLPMHGLLVLGVSLLLSVGFVAVAWLSSWRPKRERLHRAWCLLLASVVGGALWLSGAIMPNEYEPLHAFLALVAVLAASMLGTLLAEEFDAWSTRLAAGAGALLASAALLSGLHLASDEDDAWLLWSQTVASRYLTVRWSFLEAPNVDAVGAHRFVPRPNLETPQTAAWRARRAEKAPHIVIFSIDGLLPSHVGAYGYKTRSTTPNIDRVAKRGVRFNRAFSTYPATKQFNSSLLLGRLVPSYGASHAPAAFKENAITRLLDRQNYHILVKSWFEASTRNSFDARYFGIDTNLPKASAKKKGFQLEESMESRMERIEQHLLDAKAKKQPVFLWMHLLGTHPVGHEFVPDPRFAYGDSRAERYDSAIAGSDRWLPEVEKLMQAHADPTRDTIWIICSDHGVRVDVAGKDLYAHIVRVPLIIAGPGFEPRVLDETVEAPVDLAATVVDLAGIEPPASYDGISLVPLLMRGDPGGRMAQRIIPLLRGGWRGAVQGKYKLLNYNKTFSFFDSERDPEEEHNLYSERKELAQAIWASANQELERRLEAFKAKEEVAAANEPAESNARDEED